jgi:phosphoinositide-3-kinase regulatory subunit 4
LLALAQCHKRGVCHGDIKPENAALSSWDWAYLVDFAPFKPTLLPADNPADFSFFFDTSGRRKCYLAPERFYDPAAAGITPQQAATAPLTPAMVRALL